MITYILVAIAAVLLLFLYWKYFKKIRCGNMLCITGGIKTGKSSLSVRQAIQLTRSQRLKCWLFNYIGRFAFLIFGFFFHPWRLLHPVKNIRKRLKKKRMMPVLYSNIPLKYPHLPVTPDLIRRTQKPIPKSVCYICEASLLADSQSCRDGYLNEQMLLFNKLWGHASYGGYLIYDTQSISDNHYAVKRCLNSYIYIHHTIKVPFYMIMFLREERYSEDGQNINVNQGDLEKNGFMIHIVPKRVWKLFDAYCYSTFTDDCPYDESDLTKDENLKAQSIITFKNYSTLKGVHTNEGKLQFKSETTAETEENDISASVRLSVQSREEDLEEMAVHSVLSYPPHNPPDWFVQSLEKAEKDGEKE